jgi:hypothetical protein
MVLPQEESCLHTGMVTEGVAHIRRFGLSLFLHALAVGHLSSMRRHICTVTRATLAVTRRDVSPLHPTQHNPRSRANVQIELYRRPLRKLNHASFLNHARSFNCALDLVLEFRSGTKSLASAPAFDDDCSRYHLWDGGSSVAATSHRHTEVKMSIWQFDLDEAAFYQR